jgi:hypothetical protein
VKEEKWAQLHLVVCTQFRTQLYLMVGTQMLLLWWNLQASSCHRPVTGTSNKTTGCVFLCLEWPMQGYGSNDVNLSVLSILHFPDGPFFTLTLPRRLVAATHAQEGMVNHMLRLFVLPHVFMTNPLTCLALANTSECFQKGKKYGC